MRSNVVPAPPVDATRLGQDTEVLGHGPAETMAFLVGQRRAQDEAAARELRAVAHWAELHRVDTTVEVGAVDLEVWRVLEDQRAASAGADAAEPGLLGREGELRLAGEGAFTVAEFAITELAAGLGMSETAARAYVAQAIELRDRLPRCWGEVMAGRLPAWKARRIAQETVPLSGDAATYVDTHLAPFAASLSVTRVLRAVDAAVMHHDPALAAQRAEAAAEQRGVWLHDHLDGTTRIEAVTGTPDAVAFDTTLDEVATTLAALGDTDPTQVRRAKAVGVLADPQYALDLAAALDRAPTTSLDGRSGPVLHVHLHTVATDGLVDGLAVEPVARVHGGRATAGARSTAAVQRWLTDLAPGAAVTVTPVVDLTQRYAVNAYEVPDRIRAQVAERDDGCRFPWCGRTGAFDLDHIEPYRFGEPSGCGDPPDPPPSLPRGEQTSTDNLARLCRFHHRVKTHTDWDYRRNPSGTLTWRSPLGRTYTVDETGTYRHD